MLQSGGGGMEQFRMRERRNLIGWIQSIEMRDMAMLILRIIRIHERESYGYAAGWHIITPISGA
jgi:hypothetical protein